MTDAPNPRMVSVPADVVQVLLSAIENDYVNGVTDLEAPQYPPLSKALRAALAQAPSPAPAASAPAEAELRAEIEYHRIEAAQYRDKTDVWYAHISLEQVVADKLNLMVRETYWRNKLAQALAPAEGEG